MNTRIKKVNSVRGGGYYWERLIFNALPGLIVRDQGETPNSLAAVC